MADVVESTGHDDLWLWFSLSRASFCVMPRAFMHAMPDQWQRDMARLLNEWNDAWSWPDDISGSRVQVTKNGRLVRTPEWLVNYRHPDMKLIESLRRPSFAPAPESRHGVRVGEVSAQPAGSLSDVAASP